MGHRFEFLKTLGERGPLAFHLIALAGILFLAGCGENPAALNQGALECVQKEDLAGADRLLRQALAAAPTNKTLLANLIEVYFREKKWEEAVQLLKKVQTVEGLGDDPDFQKRLAEAYVMKGDSGQAFAVLKTLLERDPENEYLLFLQGIAAISPEPAVEALNKALRLNPDRKETYLALARAQSWQGDLIGARSTLTVWNQRTGNNLDTFLIDVALYLRDNDLQTARKTLSEAPAELADNPLVRLYGAYIDLTERAIATAQATFEGLADEPTVATRAKLGAALCYLMGDDPNRAIETCEEVIADSPAEAAAFCLKGLGELKRLQRFLAKKSFEQSLALNPDQPTIRALVDRLGGR